MHAHRADWSCDSMPLPSQFESLPESPSIFPLFISEPYAPAPMLGAALLTKPDPFRSPAMVTSSIKYMCQLLFVT